MIEKYSQDLEVACYESDINSRMLPTAFLNLAQEAANQHANYLGVGYDSMQITRKAWVLSRLHVRFNHTPQWRDKVNLQSWHKGANGYLYFRDFVVTDNAGRAAIEATTSWLVIDIDSRRLTKYTELAEDQERCICEDVIAEQAPKITLPGGAEPQQVGSHTARYSDLDMNGHVNNVNYVEWALDSIGFDVTSKLLLKELFVNYNAEVKLGDEVVLKVWEDTESGAAEERIFYVIGEVGGKNSFIVKLVF